MEWSYFQDYVRYSYKSVLHISHRELLVVYVLTTLEGDFDILVLNSTKNCTAIKSFEINH